MPSSEVILMLLFMFAFFITFIWGLYQANKVREIRNDFINTRLSMNKFMSMYIIVARQNRELVARYNNFKGGVRDTFFTTLMGTQEVIDFYKKYDVPQGDAREDESNKEIVNNTVKNGKENLKAWGTSLN